MSPVLRWKPSSLNAEGTGKLLSAAMLDRATTQYSDLKRLTVVAVTDHVSCDLDGEVFILHLPDGQYYGLNAVGTRVWKMIQAPIAASIVRDTLLAEYNVEAGLCEKDLLVLFRDLYERGLIEVKQPGESSADARP
jgi:hypothetical protein